MTNAHRRRLVRGGLLAAVGIALVVVLEAETGPGAWSPPSQTSKGIGAVRLAVLPYLEASDGGVAGHTVPTLPSQYGREVCGTRVFGVRQLASRAVAYVWALCEQFRVIGGKLTKWTGVSLPVVVFLSRRGSRFVALRSVVPGDGSRYARDLRRLFPAYMQSVLWAWTAHSPIRESALARRARRYFRLG